MMLPVSRPKPWHLGGAMLLAAMVPLASAVASGDGRDRASVGRADVASLEARVAAQPSDPDARAVLGDAYFRAGRTQAAIDALHSALALGHEGVRPVLSLAMAQVAVGDPLAARGTLDAFKDRLPLSDYAFALTLAGEPETAIMLLRTEAVRPDASATTRQNLAFAFAMAGRWSQARIMASQDLPLDKIDARLREWAALASTTHAPTRIATLLRVPVKADAPGMPVALALAPGTSVARAPVEVAAADPAPIERFAPLPPPKTTTTAPATPEAAAEAAQVEPVTAPTIVTTAPAREAPLIAAKPGPLRNAPTRVPVAVKPAVATSRASAPLVARAARGWSVQIGAYSTLALVKQAWARTTARLPWLAHREAISRQAVVNGRTVYRLAIDASGARGDAQRLCSTLRARSQDCFVRPTDVNAPVRWASRATPRLAQR